MHLRMSKDAHACWTAECALASNTYSEVRLTAEGLLMPLKLRLQMFSDLFRDSETIRAHHIMLNKNPNIRVGEWLEGTRRVAFLTTYQAPAWVKKLIRELLSPPTLQCNTFQDMGTHVLPQATTPYVQARHITAPASASREGLLSGDPPWVRRV